MYRTSSELKRFLKDSAYHTRTISCRIGWTDKKKHTHSLSPKYNRFLGIVGTVSTHTHSHTHSFVGWVVCISGGGAVLPRTIRASVPPRCAPLMSSMCAYPQPRMRARARVCEPLHNVLEHSVGCPKRRRDRPHPKSAATTQAATIACRRRRTNAATAKRYARISPANIPACYATRCRRRRRHRRSRVQGPGFLFVCWFCC